jgi:hypothetical protein
LFLFARALQKLCTLSAERFSKDSPRQSAATNARKGAPTAFQDAKRRPVQAIRFGEIVGGSCDAARQREREIFATLERARLARRNFARASAVEIAQMPDIS